MTARTGRRFAVVVCGVVAVGCTSGGPEPVASVAATDIEAALAAADCTPVPVADPESADHIDPATAPSAADLYEVRPGASGPHLGRWVEPRVYEDTVDERAVVHNHEHGAVSVWYDPDAIGTTDRETISTYASARNAAGLADDRGPGILVAPLPEELRGQGAAVRLRAWSAALDCAAFAADAVDGFVLETFGEAPEGHIAPDVTEVIVPG